MRVVARAELQLFGLIKKQDGWYVAHCPPLDITTQGKSVAEAKRNLSEACEMFVVSCLERGTFEQALRELGWRVAKGVPVSLRGAPIEVPTGGFRFPVPVPFGLEKTAECPA